MTSQTMILIITALSLASLWFFAMLWWSDRRHARHMRDRELEREDRQLWAQRVQAPEMATYTHAAKAEQDLPQPEQHVPFDDDEKYWAARERQDALHLAPMIGANPLGAE